VISPSSAAPRTRRSAAGDPLAVPQAQLDAAMANVESGIALWDASDRLMLANRKMAEMFGIPVAELQAGVDFRDFVRLAVETGHLDGRDADEVYGLAIELVRRRKPVTYDELLSNGRIVRVLVRPLDMGGWLATYEDVTDSQRAQAQVAFMAGHDALTKLVNRPLFLERLGEALTRIGNVAVLYLDLDRFKEVNDTLGHLTGDMLLGLVGRRLNNCFRQGDTIARLGGDEFAIMLAPGSRNSAEAAARHVVEVLRRPFQIDNDEVLIGTSVGIALAPSDGTDPHTLLKNADLALYAAKSDGRGIYRFFEQRMEDRMQSRRRLEGELRAGIANEELELFYQPLVRIGSGEVSGLEALLRWRHPVRGLVLPGEFIPLAEATRLIVPMGAWAISRACDDLSHLPSNLRLAVNLSPVQFRSRELVGTVRQALQAADVSADRLEMEITESTLMKDAETAATILRELRSIGVRIALDDFGTGYSSLSYLRKFPFDKIKIDKSFVDDLGHSKVADAIIRAVTGIAGSLGIETVAEGVEHREQFARLRQEGCDHVQGFLFGRPTPLGEVAQAIARIDGGTVARKIGPAVRRRPGRKEGPG
jgi:diguanylate cyclase (GGDEF)-like protein